MKGALGHRGLDGIHTRLTGTVGLAHFLNKTTDTADSIHSYGGPGARLLVAADVRLDNRDELISILGSSSDLGPLPSDSRLIAASYERWETSCAEKLLGDFAFVVWDEQRARIYCARDPMGVKPFYYHLSDRHFAAGSEIRALLALPFVPRRVNETRIGDHLLNSVEGLHDKEITFYRDIQRLPSGCWLKVTEREHCAREYWNLDAPRTLKLGSDAEYAEAYRQLLASAVKDRLRGPRPVGSELSGGLDSSSITCLARDALADEDVTPLHTVSAVFPNLPEEKRRRIDERPFIRSVIASGQIEPHLIEADRLNPLAAVRQTVNELGEPYFGPNVYLNRAFFRCAKTAGIRVLLSGLDGDTVVSHGDHRLAHLARTARWWTLTREVKMLLERNRSTLSLPRAIWRLGFLPLVPESVVRMKRKSLGQDANRGWARSMANESFARRIGLYERRRELIHDRSMGAKTAQERHVRELLAGQWSHGLELYDAVASHLGVEPRYPYFDRRLIEFCIALPIDQKLRNGWTRHVAREGMKGVLPEEVRLRVRKGDLATNLDFTMNAKINYEQVRLLVESDSMAEYLNQEEARTACERLFVLGAPKPGDSSLLCSVVALGAWLDTERADNQSLLDARIRGIDTDPRVTYNRDTDYSI